MQLATEQGDRIDTLLDLDQGRMTVWKNDVKLEVIQSDGLPLRGPLCWAVSIYSHGDSARIESTPRPDEPAALEVDEAADQ